MMDCTCHRRLVRGGQCLEGSEQNGVKHMETVNSVTVTLSLSCPIKVPVVNAVQINHRLVHFVQEPRSDGVKLKGTSVILLPKPSLTQRGRDKRFNVDICLAVICQ